MSSIEFLQSKTNLGPFFAAEGTQLQKLVRWLFEPSVSHSFISRVFGFLFVTPLTNVTPCALEYQLYLDQIFHRRLGSRLGHYSAMPLIFFFLLTYAATYSFSALLYVVVGLEMLYLVSGYVNRQMMLGLQMIAPLTIFSVAAHLFAETFRSDTWLWYFPTGRHLTNPFMWMWIFSCVQALSHMVEQRIPPRVVLQRNWLDHRVFFFESRNKLVWLFWMLWASLAGTLDEFLATPRLLPIFWLKVLYFLGYETVYYQLIVGISRICMLYGDPALDYLGAGPRFDYSKDMRFPAKQRRAFVERVEADKKECLREIEQLSELIDRELYSLSHQDEEDHSIWSDDSWLWMLHPLYCPHGPRFEAMLRQVQSDLRKIDVTQTLTLESLPAHHLPMCLVSRQSEEVEEKVPRKLKLRRSRSRSRRRK